SLLPRHPPSHRYVSRSHLPPPAFPGSGPVGRWPRCHPLSLFGSRTPPMLQSDTWGVSLATPDARGPLRRERLRTARLYLCCDARPNGEDPEPLLRAALNGGVDIVQLREKTLPRREIERAAQTFRRLCDTYSALFIVNDDPDLARTCDADGVHVGQDDTPAIEARAALGPDAIVGLS